MPTALAAWLSRVIVLVLAIWAIVYTAWRGIGDHEPSWLTRTWRRQRARPRYPELPDAEAPRIVYLAPRGAKRWRKRA